MADDSELKSGFESVRVVILYGLTIAGASFGVSGYVYNEKQQHRQEISTLENDLVKLDNRLTFEIERRADNELMLTNLEGEVLTIAQAVKHDRIRQENFIYQLSRQITDNRVIFSDLSALVKSAH